MGSVLERPPRPLLLLLPLLPLLPGVLPEFPGRGAVVVGVVVEGVVVVVGGRYQSPNWFGVVVVVVEVVDVVVDVRF